MEFEWDEAKRESNLRKHGLDFRDADHVEWDSAVLINDLPVHGEQRTIAIGYLRGRLVVIVYTLRDNACRIISMRPAERHERKLYSNG